MAFLENMEILKTSFPDVWQAMMEIESRLNKDLARVVFNKQGLPVLKVGKHYVHDKNQPQQEAKNFIEQFQNVKDHPDILFYGLGLGYQIKAFVEQYPNTPFSIYEPVAEIFYEFLSQVDLKEFPFNLIKNIYLERKTQDLEEYTALIAGSIRNSVMIMELPAYQVIFPEKRKAFFTLFENLIGDRRNLVATHTVFQKRWTINSLKNFIQVFTTPDVVLEKKGCFQNKPALLVASGPSLDEELENVKTIKENGLAYIFSVGTAINTLIKHGIYPDAACTYDPTRENQMVFQGLSEKDTRAVPLIFGSTVGYETLEIYPGPRMHMLISQDALSAFYLKAREGLELEIISDAASIAVIALQLLYKLGFSPIILVGLNLAYREGMQYAADSTFFPAEASQIDLENAVPVKDVSGGEVASSASFSSMRRQLEIYIEQNRDIKVINTTRHGAYIDGTQYHELQDLIKYVLRDRVVENGWLEGVKPSYDLDHLIESHQLMMNEYNKIHLLIEQCQLNLDAITQTAGTRNVRLISQSYDQFNLSMNRLRNNLFYLTLIEPMNRVEIQFLMLAVPDISREQNPDAKAQMMEREFRSYLKNCEQDLNLIGLIFEELNDSIQRHYQNYMIRKQAAGIKILLIEGDGVLTDGNIYFSARGDYTKKFNYLDRNGVLLLREKGIQPMLLNPASDPVLESAAQYLGINCVFPGEKEQALTSLAKEYKPETVAWVGNQARDLRVIEGLGLSLAVKEA
ncbi:MAG: 6-hydroxymethylpterin diphosphokinase MptE-like protein, partial [Chitinophagales bacterium]